MTYLALGIDGNIHNLGECVDWAEAEEKQEQMKLDAVWLFDAETAEEWVKAINRNIKAETNEN